MIQHGGQGNLGIAGVEVVHRTGNVKGKRELGRRSDGWPDGGVVDQVEQGAARHVLWWQRQADNDVNGKTEEDRGEPRGKGKKRLDRECNLHLYPWSESSNKQNKTKKKKKTRARSRTGQNVEARRVGVNTKEAHLRSIAMARVHG